MELTFLGRGAAFNPKEGNNSAYFIEKDELFLIDCGERIFDKLIETKLLEKNQNINLMITHTHSDHIGSIGSLVMYYYFNLHKKINIILPEKAKHLPNIQKILDGFGCTKEMYNYISEKEFDGKYQTFETIRYTETDHCDPLHCYSLIFNTNDGTVYYSGDTREINTIKKIISNGQKIDKLYIDTSSSNFEESVHLYIGAVEKAIPNNLKDHVYCMHLSDDECIIKAKKIGFNVVEVKK